MNGPGGFQRKGFPDKRIAGETLRVKSRGFTLVELLVFAAVFTLVVGAFVAILSAATHIESNQTSVTDVETQGQFLIEQIQNYVRSSRLVAMREGETSSTLTLTNEAATDFDSIYLSGGTVYVKQGVNATPIPLSSDKVIASDVSFTRHWSSVASSSAYGAEAVQFSFTLSANTTNPQMEYTQSFQSSAALMAHIGAVALLEQAKGEASGSNQPNVSANFPAPPGAGDLLVAVVSNTGGQSAAITLSDTASSTWTKAVGQSFSQYDQQLAIYYSPNYGGTGSSESVRASFSPSVSSPSLFVYDYRGAATSSPLDLTSAGFAYNTSTPSSASSTPSNAETELVLGAMYSNPSTEIPSPGIGFTLETTSTVSATYVEDEPLYVTGSTAAGWIYGSTSPTSSMLMATFKAAN